MAATKHERYEDVINIMQSLRALQKMTGSPFEDFTANKVVRDEKIAFLKECFDCLSEHEQKLLILRYGKNLIWKEIQDQMDISHFKARSLHNHAINTFAIMCYGPDMLFDDIPKKKIMTQFRCLKKKNS